MWAPTYHNIHDKNCQICSHCAVEVKCLLMSGWLIGVIPSMYGCMDVSVVGVCVCVCVNKHFS